MRIASDLCRLTTDSCILRVNDGEHPKRNQGRGSFWSNGTAVVDDMAYMDGHDPRL